MNTTGSSPAADPTTDIAGAFQLLAQEAIDLFAVVEFPSLRFLHLNDEGRLLLGVAADRPIEDMACTEFLTSDLLTALLYDIGPAALAGGGSCAHDSLAELPGGRHHATGEVGLVVGMCPDRQDGAEPLDPLGVRSRCRVTWWEVVVLAHRARIEGRSLTPLSCALSVVGAGGSELGAGFGTLAS